MHPPYILIKVIFVAGKCQSIIDLKLSINIINLSMKRLAFKIEKHEIFFGWTFFQKSAHFNFPQTHICFWKVYVLHKRCRQLSKHSDDWPKMLKFSYSLTSLLWCLVFIIHIKPKKSLIIVWPQIKNIHGRSEKSKLKTSTFWRRKIIWKLLRRW